MWLFKVTQQETPKSQRRLSHLEHNHTTPKAKWVFAKQGLSAHKKVIQFSHNCSDTVDWGQGIVLFSWIQSTTPSSV